MKKFWTLIITLIFLVALTYAVFQSPIGQNLIRNQITKTLKKSGYESQIGRIEGALPNRIELKDIKIKKGDQTIEMKSLTLKPILWRLLKKELAFKNVHAQSVTFEGSQPFNFEGKFFITKKRIYAKGKLDSHPIAVRFYLPEKRANFSFYYKSSSFKGRASFSPDYDLLSANIQFSDDQILEKLPIQSSGVIFANAHIVKENEKYLGDLKWQIPDLEVEGRRKGLMKGDGDFSYSSHILKGTLRSTLAKLDFDLSVLSNFLFEGNLHLNAENLATLYIPDTYGSLDLNANLFENDAVQSTHIEAQFSNASYQSIQAQTVKGQMDLKELKVEQFDIELTNGSIDEVTVDSMQITGRQKEVQLDAKGSWNKPFDCTLIGTLNAFDHFSLHLLSGRYNKLPFLLEDPVQIKYQNKELSISKALIVIDSGSVSFEIKPQKIELSGKDLPLDLFSMNPYGESVMGFLDLDLQLEKKKEMTSGNFFLNVNQIEPFWLKGKIEGELSGKLAQISADFSSENEKFLLFEASVPILLDFWPWKARINPDAQMNGKLRCNARAERFLEYFNLGSHHLEGNFQADINFKNTFSKPIVEGEALFNHGLYENYYTGTYLKEINAQFLADGNRIYLQHLNALDLSDDPFEAVGHVDLKMRGNYPFTLRLQFNEFRLAQVDLVNAKATGKLKIEGNSLSSVVEGNIYIDEATLTIPNHIPKPLPELEVTYKNPIKKMIEQPKFYTPYPLLLDLNVSAPKVLIEGRGLDSQWKGEFELGGSATSPATEGKLELIEGQFNFSSRKFKLTEGSLAFSGVEYQMPHLNLAGTMETKGILITARLAGPLDDPNLTLQSSPPLPLGSIVSYLLFGQDISEVSGFQALQIASSLASLAGTGPDIMESTRKSLGVDRLRVIANPSEEGGESVSLEVGKYVADGVLVSISQGNEESSTNISIEIELKNNFVFQIESDQRQEQGKFTLKWNLNY